MYSRVKNLFAAVLVCVSTLIFSADASAAGWYRRFDNAIRRFLLSGVDTTYVGLPSTSWEIPTALTLYGETMNIVSYTGEEMQLNSGGAVSEAGIGIGYHGLDYIQYFTLTENVFSGHFEFNFYDNSWGFQLINSNYRYASMGVGTSELTLSGYIALNGSKYSYPAVYYGNYIQKKSAGSPIVYFWYDHITDYSLDPSVEVDESMKNIRNFSVCGGYGYNWAFNEGKTLVNASGSLGLIGPYWGIATEFRATAMHWFNEHLRINLAAVQYFSFGKRHFTEPYFLDQWMFTLSLAYCFGK